MFLCCPGVLSDLAAQVWLGLGNRLVVDRQNHMKSLLDAVDSNSNSSSSGNNDISSAPDRRQEAIDFLAW